MGSAIGSAPASRNREPRSARPPIQAWQPGVALAGFVLGIVRFHVWETALHLGSAGLPWILLLAAVVAGTIASVIVLIKPEAP